MSEKRDYRLYTAEEDEFIKENMSRESQTQIAKCLGRSASSVCRRIKKIQAERVERLRQEYRAEKETGVTTAATCPVEASSPLKNFTPRELMEELRNRGYIGKLRYTEIVVHEIDLSKL